MVNKLVLTRNIRRSLTLRVSQGPQTGGGIEDVLHPYTRKGPLNLCQQVIHILYLGMHLIQVARIVSVSGSNKRVALPWGCEDKASIGMGKEDYSIAADFGG
jgi:hypothetical protein